MNYMKFLFLDWTKKDTDDATRYINRTTPIVGLLMLVLMGCLLIMMIIGGEHK